MLTQRMGRWGSLVALSLAIAGCSDGGSVGDP